jgi:hypothetical protein
MARAGARAPRIVQGGRGHCASHPHVGIDAPRTTMVPHSLRPSSVSGRAGLSRPYPRPRRGSSTNVGPPSWERCRAERCLSDTIIHCPLGLPNASGWRAAPSSTAASTRHVTSFVGLTDFCSSLQKRTHSHLTKSKREHFSCVVADWIVALEGEKGEKVLHALSFSLQE